MGRLPEREVRPSREAMGDRRGPSFGSKLNVSVPISVGLPLIVVGLFVIFTAVQTGQAVLWILGGVMTLLGAVLFASGKRL
jgi:hypothetical protein